MKNPFAWVIAVVAVLLWSANELYPPTDRPLLEQFERASENTQDPTFQAILKTARELEAKDAGNTKAGSTKAFNNLLAAAGTNSLERYFPHIEIPSGKETNRVILQKLQRDALGQIKTGLDIRGGMEFTVRMQTEKLAENGGSAANPESALDQAVEILRKRIDRFGVAEPSITKAGEDRIKIQMPGLTESERTAVRDTIGRTAALTFCMVHPENDRLLTEGLVPPGYRILNEVRTDKRTGKTGTIPMLVKKNPERGLTGKYIVNADAIPDPITGEPKIEFELNNEGAQLFAEITKEFSPRPGAGGTKYYQLGIVLDGELYSAPQILGEIAGGRGVITGHFDMKEAFQLANVLKNPLAAPLEILEQRTVDPSLGADSVKSGLRAAVIGAALVSGFMLVYYMLCGVIANIALLFNIFILLGVMCAVDTTLTLPGIAGIVLTIGMAVDANVLIYERVREELAAGKSLRGAINAGYGKAFWTIFDSNLTTVFSSLIMMWLGTGPVKGFGVALTIGIAVSMFTALVVTRLIFDWLLAKNLIKNLSMLHLIKGSNFDFMRFAKPAFIASWLLIVVGIGYGFSRGSGVLGVEFAGGDSVTFSFEKKLPVDAVREAVVKAGLGEGVIGYSSSLGGGLENLRVTVKYGSGEALKEKLPAAFADAGLKVMGEEKIGPTVGEEIQLSAVKSVLLAMFCILVYVAFRYEFSFSVGAVVAIIHDVLMTLGWFFLTGRELSAPMVAAVLTIIGFSINDTIVIFDRIREDLRLGVKGSFREVMNVALNETLSRTIITSGTAFLATVALYVFGGGVVNDFAFTFMVGVITGTYSSIYIAGAIVLWWHKGQRPVIGPVQQQQGAAAPQIQQPARA